MQFHLYGNRDSGHSYKVALALKLSGQVFDYTAIDLELPREARPEPFRSTSRFGEVPLLLIDGVAHSQSDAILLALSGRIPALALEPGAVDLAREWLFWEANRIGFSVPNLRFALGGAHHTPRDVILWLRARVASDLVRLDQELTGRRYLLGPKWSIADIACAAYLYWPEHLKHAAQKWEPVLREEACDNKKTGSCRDSVETRRDPGSEVRFPVHVAAWLERLAEEPGWAHPYQLLA